MKQAAILVFFTASVAWAAPEDRGMRGMMLSAGSGLAAGTATDETGRDAGGFLGHGTVIRIGEEALPGLTLGLEVLFGKTDANTQRYASTLMGLVVQLSYRPLDTLDGLVLLIGTGIGGGELTSDGDDPFTGAVAGGLHELGINYEMPLTGDSTGGLVAALGARWIGVPASGETPTTIQTFLFGVEMIWYAGRD